MSDKLSTLLAERDWILADWGDGHDALQHGSAVGRRARAVERGPSRPHCHASTRGAVDAGSDLFLTNSFGGTAARLKLHDAQDRVFELNRLAAEIGREVADAQTRTVIVAGSMGPHG